MLRKLLFVFVHNSKGVGFQPLVAVFSSMWSSPTSLVYDALIREWADGQIQRHANKNEMRDGDRENKHFEDII